MRAEAETREVARGSSRSPAGADEAEDDLDGTAALGAGTPHAQAHTEQEEQQTRREASARDVAEELVYGAIARATVGLRRARGAGTGGGEGAGAGERTAGEASVPLPSRALRCYKWKPKHLVTVGGARGPSAVKLLAAEQARAANVGARKLETHRRREIEAKDGRHAAFGIYLRNGALG